MGRAFLHRWPHGRAQPILHDATDRCLQALVYFSLTVLLDSGALHAVEARLHCLLASFQSWVTGWGSHSRRHSHGASQLSQPLLVGQQQGDVEAGPSHPGAIQGQQQVEPAGQGRGWGSRAAAGNEDGDSGSESGAEDEDVRAERLAVQAAGPRLTSYHVSVLHLILSWACMQPSITTSRGNGLGCMADLFAAWLRPRMPSKNLYSLLASRWLLTASRRITAREGACWEGATWCGPCAACGQQCPPESASACWESMAQVSQQELCMCCGAGTN